MENLPHSFRQHRKENEVRRERLMRKYELIRAEISERKGHLVCTNAELIEVFTRTKNDVPEDASLVCKTKRRACEGEPNAADNEMEQNAVVNRTSTIDLPMTSYWRKKSISPHTTNGTLTSEMHYVCETNKNSANGNTLSKVEEIPVSREERHCQLGQTGSSGEEVTQESSSRVCTQEPNSETNKESLQHYQLPHPAGVNEEAVLLKHLAIIPVDIDGRYLMFEIPFYFVDYNSRNPTQMCKDTNNQTAALVSSLQHYLPCQKETMSWSEKYTFLRNCKLMEDTSEKESTYHLETEISEYKLCYSGSSGNNTLRESHDDSQVDVILSNSITVYGSENHYVDDEGSRDKSSDNFLKFIPDTSIAKLSRYDTKIPAKSKVGKVAHKSATCPKLFHPPSMGQSLLINGTLPFSLSRSLVTSADQGRLQTGVSQQVSLTNNILQHWKSSTNRFDGGSRNSQFDAVCESPSKETDTYGRKHICNPKTSKNSDMKPTAPPASKKVKKTIMIKDMLVMEGKVMRPLLTKKFVEQFKMYARRNRCMTTGVVITKNSATIWLRERQIFDGNLTPAIAQELFESIAGLSLVLNVQNFICYLMKISKHAKMDIEDILRRLSGCTSSCE